MHEPWQLPLFRGRDSVCTALAARWPQWPFGDLRGPSAIPSSHLRQPPPLSLSFSLVAVALSGEPSRRGPPLFFGSLSSSSLSLPLFSSFSSLTPACAIFSVRTVSIPCQSESARPNCSIWDGFENYVFEVANWLSWQLLTPFPQLLSWYRLKLASAGMVCTLIFG